jgi:hypothetical protein
MRVTGSGYSYDGHPDTWKSCFGYILVFVILISILASCVLLTHKYSNKTAVPFIEEGN